MTTARTSHTPPLPQSFYAIALTEADRAGLDDARQMEGLSEEIALLRLHVRDALIAHRDDAKLIESGVRLLIQSLLAQHRISPEEHEEVWGQAADFLEQTAEDMKHAPDA